MLAISWLYIDLPVNESTHSLNLYKAAPLVLRHLKTRHFLSKCLGLTNERRVVYLAPMDGPRVAIDFTYVPDKHIK